MGSLQKWPVFCFIYFNHSCILLVIQLNVSPANTMTFAFPHVSLKLKRNPSLSHGKHK